MAGTSPLSPNCPRAPGVIGPTARTARGPSGWLVPPRASLSPRAASAGDRAAAPVPGVCRVASPSAPDRRGAGSWATLRAAGGRHRRRRAHRIGVPRACSCPVWPLGFWVALPCPCACHLVFPAAAPAIAQPSTSWGLRAGDGPLPSLLHLLLLGPVLQRHVPCSTPRPPWGGVCRRGAGDTLPPSLYLRFQMNDFLPSKVTHSLKSVMSDSGMCKKPF